MEDADDSKGYRAFADNTFDLRSFLCLHYYTFDRLRVWRPLSIAFKQIREHCKPHQISYSYMRRLPYNTNSSAQSFLGIC